jgi:hypothetical protein
MFRAADFDAVRRPVTSVTTIAHLAWAGVMRLRDITNSVLGYRLTDRPNCCFITLGKVARVYTVSPRGGG